jgi:hypothetical protein
MERPCPLCGTSLPIDPPQGPDPRGRMAYDPLRGRLWRVCPGCERWHPVPLVYRWEALERNEELVATRGRVLLSSDELSLVSVDGGELIRVGRPLAEGWAGWRYGRELPAPLRPRKSFFRRLLEGLPSVPVEGYDPYGFGRVAPSHRWFASPFLESAGPLTAAFTRVPLAPECPSCHEPLPVLPWKFQRIRFEDVSTADPTVAVPCGRCGEEVLVPVREARPALRLGLALVTPRRASGRARPAARRIQGVGGAHGFMVRLARERVALGELGTGLRLALGMVLDDLAETEALEREWREAEELAAIMDGELTEVPGFQEFRRSVLEGDN